MNKRDEKMDKYIVDAFIKAMDWKDYATAERMNNIKIKLDFMPKRMSRKYYLQFLDVMKSCDYMYYERKALEEILNEN